MYDVIIVGAGPVGLYTSYLSHLQNLKVKIIEASNVNGGQMLLFKDKPIYDLPAHLNVTGKDILSYLRKQLEISQIDINYEEKFVDFEGEYPVFNVRTNLNNYRTRTIIFSSGGGVFEPIKLGVHNEGQFSNLSYKVEDAYNYRDKNILIFGGGDSAVDWAHFFMNKSKKVTLIHRRDIFRSQEKLLTELKNSIYVLTPYKVHELIGIDKVEKIVLKHTKRDEYKELDCDNVFVFFGHKKTIDKNLNTKVDQNINGFKVKSNMETSVEGIFAIGNVANYEGKLNMLVTGFGESATAVGSVVFKIYNGKKMSYYIKTSKDKKD